MKKILVLGGTGAMGVYLVPKLLRRGYAVDVVSLDQRTSDDPNLRYITANAMELSTLTELLQGGYAGIVDFLIYRTEQFRERYKMFLASTDHYIYLSTYRIYAGASPITEESPRLLDASDDADFLGTEDYSLFKARGEDMLAASGASNYTVIRPAVTFSHFRFQLVTLEAPVVIGRMQAGKTVLLPEEALDVQATMSWAGDVAEMIARLLFAPHAMRERYTLATAEHQSWGTVAEYYRDIGGLTYRGIPTEDYLRIQSGGGTILPAVRYQVIYDRLFSRVVDNRKILEATGLTQAELMPVKAGLRMEYENLPRGYVWPTSKISGAMDAWIVKNGE